MLKNFKDFALKGNLVDLAIGVVIGTAFGKVVSSFVSDVIMPPIGMLLGGINFSNLFVSLDSKHYNSLAEAKAAGAATINYGLFLSNLFDFFIIALTAFFVIRALMRIKVAGLATTKPCSECLSLIPVGAKRCAHCAVVLA
jgi:large conductance mechanosensitive channel